MSAAEAARLLALARDVPEFNLTKREWRGGVIANWCLTCAGIPGNDCRCFDTSCPND